MDPTVVLIIVAVCLFIYFTIPAAMYWVRVFGTGFERADQRREERRKEREAYAIFLEQYTKGS